MRGQLAWFPTPLERPKRESLFGLGNGLAVARESRGACRGNAGCPARLCSNPKLHPLPPGEGLLQPRVPDPAAGGNCLLSESR